MCMHVPFVFCVEMFRLENGGGGGCVVCFLGVGGGGEATALSVRGFGAFAWKDVMNKKYAVMESF